MRIALAANRASGGGFDPEPLIAAMRVAGADVTLHGCGTEDVERIAAAAPDRLAVAGGDGTIAPVAELAGRLGVPLAVVPTGTANDFARANHLPGDPVEAARLAAAGTETRSLELARLADGHPFVNVAGAGLATVAARRAQPLKPRLGPLAYGVGALRAAASSRPLEATVRVDGRTVHDGPCWQAIVAATGAFGGGSGIAEADPRDGALDAVVLPAGSRLALARRAWGLRTHTIAEQSPVTSVRGRTVEVTLPAATECNVDGELHDAAAMRRITVQPAAFALVVG
jgi:diacylglycerol kinase family enzyme